MKISKWYFIKLLVVIFLVYYLAFGINFPIMSEYLKLSAFVTFILFAISYSISSTKAYDSNYREPKPGETINVTKLHQLRTVNKKKRYILIYVYTNFVYIYKYKCRSEEAEISGGIHHIGKNGSLIRP